MALRVAIFGFGKVGRSVFRALYHRHDAKVVATLTMKDVRDAWDAQQASS